MKFNRVKPDPANPADMGVSWIPEGFLGIDTFLSGAGSIFILIDRVASRKYRALVVAAILLGFMWIWVEPAVGLFTNWGS